MPIEKFEACLLNHEVPRASYAGIFGDKKRGTCVTRSVNKKALNPLYWKAKVADNSVDVTPFKNGDNFL